MLPGIHNIDAHTKGDYWDGIEFQVVDEDNDDAPIDLTNATIRSQFRKDSPTGTIALDVSNGSGITVVDAVDGIIKYDPLLIDWTVAVYHFDTQFTFPGTQPRTYIKGIFPIVQDTTYTS